MKILSTEIKLDDMRFYAFHGAMKQEETVGATYIVNISLLVEQTEGAILCDRLEETVNYADVYALVKREMQTPSKLLERVAGRISQTLLDAFPKIVEIKTEVAKENPPIGADCNSSAVVLKVSR